ERVPVPVPELLRALPAAAVRRRSGGGSAADRVGFGRFRPVIDRIAGAAANRGVRDVCAPPRAVPAVLVSGAVFVVVAEAQRSGGIYSPGRSNFAGPVILRRMALK